MSETTISKKTMHILQSDIHAIPCC